MWFYRRTWLWPAVALVVALVAWRHRDELKEFFSPPPEPAKPIVFDNGTVRDTTPPPPEADAAAAPAPLPRGVMRKCLRGSEVNYTDRECPPGFKEKPVSGSKFTVVPGQGGGAANPSPPPAKPGADRPKTLKDALDMRPDDRLRERAIDRAIDPSSK